MRYSLNVPGPTGLHMQEVAIFLLCLGLFFLAVLLLLTYFWPKNKRRLCPKPECNSTNVIELGKDTTGYQRYQCMSCGHIHRVDPLQPKDLAETAQTN